MAPFTLRTGRSTPVSGSTTTPSRIVPVTGSMRVGRTSAELTATAAAGALEGTVAIVVRLFGGIGASRATAGIGVGTIASAGNGTTLEAGSARFRAVLTVDTCIAPYFAR